MTNEAFDTVIGPVAIEKVDALVGTSSTYDCFLWVGQRFIGRVVNDNRRPYSRLRWRYVVGDLGVSKGYKTREEAVKALAEEALDQSSFADDTENLTQLLIEARMAIGRCAEEASSLGNFMMSRRLNEMCKEVNKIFDKVMEEEK